MAKKTLFWVLLIILASGLAFGQEKYFGKNKVQFKQFEWQYIQTRHFDIYFADQMYETAKFASSVLESAYVVVSDQLNYHLSRRVPVFIYNSPNDFQQTNIIPSLLPEGVGGFTEAFKNRIAIPFNGSTEDFRHVLHHELTHAVTYDMLFGNMFSSLLSRQRLFDLPLWFAEGYAEYSSRYGWDYYADMVVRDATINNYLMPPMYLGGYLAYKQGQAMINYIVDNYGEQKIGEFLAKGKVLLTSNKAMKASAGIETKDFYENFAKEMKRRYWPEIAKRKEAKEFAKPLTDHTKDGSNYNGNPIFSPKGDRLAIYSDRKDYTEVYLISAIDGQLIDRLVKAERSGDLESLHYYYSGVTFSPDGERIAFVVKTQGRDAIYFLTVKDKNIYKRKHFNFNSILDPVWSPDGKKIAFSGLDGRKREIIIYDIEKDETMNLKNDTFDDTEPSWFPDSRHIAFSSSRPHPDNDFILTNPDYTPEDSLDWWTIYSKFDYANYSLFAGDIESGTIKPIHCGPGQNHSPQVSPTGDRVVFVSNRNGIDNLYITHLDSSTTYAIIDILTGVDNPSWSPEGDKIAFSSFGNGGFDVYLLKDLKPVGNNGVLEPTDFVKGLYGKPSVQYALNADEEPVEDTLVDKESALEAHEAASAADDTATVTAEESEAIADSTEVAEKVEDSTEVTETAADSTEVAEEPAETKPVAPDSTRIEDGDYIFVAEPHQPDPLDTIFSDVTFDQSRDEYLEKQRLSAFDSIASNNTLPSGEYKVYDYKVKFTPDYVNGGFSYDTFFGLRGQSVFVFSDYLGDHQIYLITDLVNTIDQTNISIFYLYNKLRTNFGVGAFHTKNFYIDNYDLLFSDRFYGFQGYASYPFSTFFRAEAYASQYFIDRKYHDVIDPRPDRSSKVTTAGIGFVQDNIIWGVTGPLNGRRSRLDLEGAIDLFNASDISYYAAELDYRKYWHIKSLFSMAFRLSGGASWGDTPKRYFLGGTSNKIGSTTVDAEVYDVENLYFSQIVTPLRGYNYFDFSGDKYFLANFEFRYPFVDYLKMNFPLPLTIGYVTGNWFYDMGAAWEGDNFKGGTSADGTAHLKDIKSAFGFGIRANLGIFVLRYDLAWNTDWATVAAHPKSYFSIGADF
ncbi:MAG: hypothetical protein CVT49_15200 [candidate division Zixibacteria bacterium HGW-Zixibacteria-1]|nr:MAG: hypothetical protein CVT49_15200 [candidate division Zixibacteria bacterium HGW-Zixibacteria-1]